MFDKRLPLTVLAALAPLAVAVCGGGEDPSGIADPSAVDDRGAVTAAVHDSAAVLPEGRTTPEPPDSLAYDGRIVG
ncbi:MAG TPA: hypothetical protein VFQ22_08135, partial [Longimicrobiales bacterium]|nr:hypothetical protein [Longimicrobiales bacterium]